jgi:hypothetical protein
MKRWWSVRGLLAVAMVAGWCGSGRAQDPATGSAPPSIKYVVAAPRACILGPSPLLLNQPASVWPVLAGAENFARADGALKVASGMRVIFSLSNELEGLWYRNSFGLIATSVRLEMLRRVLDPVTSQYREEWIPLGRDGARDLRRGPSIGKARVGVPVLFPRPGAYVLRAIVRTEALPMLPVTGTTGTTEPTRLPPAADEDIVRIRVKVVSLPIGQLTPDEPPAPEPDEGHVAPLPKEVDPTAPVPLSADVNGDARVDLLDFVLLSQDWGNEAVAPQVE